MTVQQINMAMRAGAKNDALPGSILLVIHNFVARSADELSLAKGDRIELIERDDDFGDGWFLGRHMTNGNTGLFPEVYTTPAPKGTAYNTAANRRASDGPQKVALANNVVSPSVGQQRHASTPAVRPASSTIVQHSSNTPNAQRVSAPIPASLVRSNAVHSDSPVMSETLSVIDEHMNDMHAPRPGFASGNQRDTVASSIGSVYSAQPPNRFSYIAGHETDEEEHQVHSEAEVMAWTPDRVAEYLEDNGVEKMHCDVFREQEITGEVLLAMDQSSLFIKEFELGPVGRRLKTWHRVKALQDEVKQAAVPASQTEIAELPGSTEDLSDAGRARSSTMGSALPRALSTTSRPGEVPSRGSTLQSMSSQSVSPIASRPSGMSPLQSMTSMSRTENTYRPSAQTIRAMQHSRRHSSIDSTANSIDSVSRTSHRKQPSIDQKWQPIQGQPVGSRPGHIHALSSETVAYKRESTGAVMSHSPNDLDRGYFSSNESRDATRSHARSMSANRAMSTHNSPIAEQRIGRSPQTASSFNSPETALGGSGTLAGGAAWGTMGVVSSKPSNARSATSPLLQNQQADGTSDGTSPVVTKLEYDDGLTSSPAADDNKTSSPTTSHRFHFFSSQKSKITGLRTISDAVTKEEKSVASPEKEFKMDSPARGGAVTPSTDATSIDLQKSEVQSRTSQGSASNLVSAQGFVRRPRARTKTKKATSAYTRGLERKPPAEQMQGCDYSGWMKKKSGSLMTTWKTRLFVLRGRRLSYYYSDDDSEEKGLIDISFHRVLPAQNEMLTGLHASLTGAVGSPTSPKESTTETAAQIDLKQPLKPGDTDDDGLFIFKLLPPKTGLSKGVNFTKPTVHYFAVNSRREGRLWMAALMKATIDRDEDGVVTTTYNQKTISLSKARARKERPPALRDEDIDLQGEDGDESVRTGASTGGVLDVNGAKELGTTGEQKGLGIGGMTQNAAMVNTAASVNSAGVERESEDVRSSFAPSSTALDVSEEGTAAERGTWLEMDRETFGLQDEN